MKKGEIIDEANQTESLIKVIKELHKKMKNKFKKSKNSIILLCSKPI